MATFTCASCGKQVDDQCVVLISRGYVEHGRVTVERDSVELYCAACSKAFGMGESDHKLQLVIRSEIPAKYANLALLRIMAEEHDPVGIVFERVMDGGTIVQGRINYGGEWCEFTYRSKDGKLIIEDPLYGDESTIVPFIATG